MGNDTPPPVWFPNATRLVAWIGSTAAVISGIITAGVAGVTAIQGSYEAAKENTRKEAQVQLEEIKSRSELASSLLTMIFSRSADTDRLLIYCAFAKLAGHPLAAWAEEKCTELNEKVDQIQQAASLNVQRAQEVYTLKTAAVLTGEVPAPEKLKEAEKIEDEIVETATEIATLTSQLAREGVSVVAQLQRSNYTVYLHFGKRGQSYIPNAAEVQKVLAGYVLKGPDDEVDESGAGVDYFHDMDRAAAEDVAAALNALLPPGARYLVPRKQPVANKPGTLGVWF